jgi:SAM-dependent methyltransferase
MRRFYEYDNWEMHWLRLQEGSSLNAVVKYRQAFILRCIQRLEYAPNCIMDIGSGTGDLIAYLISHNIGKERIGVELSAEGVESAQRKAPNALFLQEDMYAPSSFLRDYEDRADLLICSEVIEHLDDPLAFLINLKRYMAPSGKILITVPGGPLYQFARMIGHRQHFTQETITSLLKQAEFSVEKVYLAGFPFVNLYRLLCSLRGEKLYDDLEHISPLYRVGNTIFKYLFHCTWDHSPWGWQIVAVASHI